MSAGEFHYRSGAVPVKKNDASFSLLSSPPPDAHVLPTQTQTVLQATPSPVPNYIPPNSNTSKQPRSHVLDSKVMKFCLFALGFEPYLLFTTPLSINQIRPNGRNIRVVIPELGNADAVDFDIRFVVILFDGRSI